MEKITYTFADGKTAEIEVTEAFKKEYRKLDEDFKKKRSKVQVASKEEGHFFGQVAGRKGA